ncbi:conserved hypothetical protein [Talaromyces stipitatus ATCC 10500]|uniref:25S rRNA (Uridine(2843)-N(3))-methyltransferase n=1 Tax=Talaromyces stipitatus (strain ATCC 10500 / CBS 375.48 / QM 6759 / NRRL 1006) TaxID=441959 RepID=B8M244_TALSN|nr:uncharacterized protein TSTA_087440 [Talaromyces stipitatus ATCC 10500]EED21508.1 conserved hypothetical protein [Talaromyces stipitatus ATCC 10500]
MAGPTTKPGKSKGKPKPAKKQQQSVSTKKPSSRKEDTTTEDQIDFSSAANSISSDVQQALLNVFKHALFSSAEDGEEDMRTQIQQLKTYLYNRDFESAFADASPSLLRAYALRWSASRCLAYCGLFRGVLDFGFAFDGVQDGGGEEEVAVLCIGGGAGAEIVALAGAWRVLYDEDSANAVEGIERLSLNESVSEGNKRKRKLSITAIDIAEWSDVVHRLTTAIHSNVPGTKTCPTPLIQDRGSINISFQKLDILCLSEENLRSLLHRQRLISLMFTLNELFSTSISKTTQLLLRITDIASPGTMLMVVDSPGSYSTLSLSKSQVSDTQQQQRQYPMKFLLDHTLLNVAEASWEKIVSQNSRWFRKDVNNKLHYNVDLEGGQGFIKLEDMRFQIHVYRRLAPSSNEIK